MLRNISCTFLKHLILRKVNKSLSAESVNLRSLRELHSIFSRKKMPWTSSYVGCWEEFHNALLPSPLRARFEFAPVELDSQVLALSASSTSLVHRPLEKRTMSSRNGIDWPCVIRCLILKNWGGKMVGEIFKVKERISPGTGVLCPPYKHLPWTDRNSCFSCKWVHTVFTGSESSFPHT